MYSGGGDPAFNGGGGSFVQEQAAPALPKYFQAKKTTLMALIIANLVLQAIVLILSELIIGESKMEHKGTSMFTILLVSLALIAFKGGFLWGIYKQHLTIVKWYTYFMGFGAVCTLIGFLLGWFGFFSTVMVVAITAVAYLYWTDLKTLQEGAI